jgi:hypothetical protein
LTTSSACERLKKYLGGNGAGKARRHSGSGCIWLEPGFTIREANAYQNMLCYEPGYKEKMTDALRQAGLPE